MVALALIKGSLTAEDDEDDNEGELSNKQGLKDFNKLRFNHVRGKVMKQILSILASKHFFGLSLILAFSMLVPIAAFGQGSVSLPEGAGFGLVASKCTTCHVLSTALVKRASPTEWDETVSRMITNYMAPISTTDKDIIVEYLSVNFGEGIAYNPGRQMLAEQCFRCHGEGMWLDMRTDRDGWLSVLYRMVGRGGIWTEDQINVMADYLSETYPAGGGE